MGPCDNKLAVLYLCVICPQLRQVRRNIRGTVGICPYLILVQRNDYETDPYFLKNFQSNRTVCVIVRVENMVVNLKLFKKKSKQKMTQESKQKQFQVHNHVGNSYKTRKSTLLKTTTVATLWNNLSCKVKVVAQFLYILDIESMQAHVPNKSQCTHL